MVDEPSSTEQPIPPPLPTLPPPIRRLLLNNAPLTDWIMVYNLFRDYVKHEDDLINNRLMWILSIHGFLYATYGFTIQKKLEVARQLAVDTKDLTREHFLCYFQKANLSISVAQIELFLACIVIVGFFISFVGLVSIAAARAAQYSVRDIFHCQFTNTHRQRYGAEHTFKFGNNGKEIIVPSITGGGAPQTHKRGAISPIWIPSILMASWIVAGIYSLIYILQNSDYVKALLRGAQGC
jgi:hypothetical protein